MRLNAYALSRKLNTNRVEQRLHFKGSCGEFFYIMSRAELLKKLLPGFIPLFVFIAADEIWGTKIGLFVAVGVGVVEMVWVGLKEKRFDKFILFDTALLVILGAVSIFLENDIFF